MQMMLFVWYVGIQPASMYGSGIKNRKYYRCKGNISHAFEITNDMCDERRDEKQITGKNISIYLSNSTATINLVFYLIVAVV